MERKPFWFLAQEPRHRGRRRGRAARPPRPQDRQLRAEGLPRDEAGASDQAIRRSGGHAALLPAAAQRKERGHAATTGDGRPGAGRCGLRCAGLLRAPLLAATIVASVGLGIGRRRPSLAVIDAALLRPLPYADPIAAGTHLYRLAAIPIPLLGRRLSGAGGAADDVHEGSRLRRPVDDLHGRRDRGRVCAAARSPRATSTPWASRRRSGATSPTREARPGGQPSVIVSRPVLAPAPRRAGRRDRPADYASTSAGLRVVGVLPRVTGPLEFGQDYFVAAHGGRHPAEKGRFSLPRSAACPIGHRPAAASAELREIDRRLFPLWKTSYQDDKATWGLMDLKTYLAGDFRSLAGLALAAVGLVWLIACVNASNLLIARVTSRRRELAVRAALGASRSRVVRYLLAESAVLAVLASARSASALAWFGIVAAARSAGAPTFRARRRSRSPARTLAVSSALTDRQRAAVRAGAGDLRRRRSGRRRAALGGAIVHGHRASAACAASSSAASSPSRCRCWSSPACCSPASEPLRHVDLGFDPHNVLTGAVSCQRRSTATRRMCDVLGAAASADVARLPGVAVSAFADSRPPSDAGNHNNFDLEDFPDAGGTVAAGDDVGRRHARILRRVRADAGRRPAVDARDTTAANPSSRRRRSSPGRGGSFRRGARWASG